jgi:hypothetical protein
MFWVENEASAVPKPEMKAFPRAVLQIISEKGDGPEALLRVQPRLPLQTGWQ